MNTAIKYANENSVVEKFNALPCLYDDLAEKARYFEIMAEVEE